MSNDSTFIPADHVGFVAKWLASKEQGAPANVFLGQVDSGGGGPKPPHTHPHDHIFIIVSGKAKVIIGEERRILGSDEAIHVPGDIPHSIWNEGEGELKMIGISIDPAD